MDTPARIMTVLSDKVLGAHLIKPRSKWGGLYYNIVLKQLIQKHFDNNDDHRRVVKLKIDRMLGKFLISIFLFCFFFFFFFFFFGGVGGER